MRWIKTNLFPLIVTLLLTAAFSYMFSNADSMKKEVTSHEVANATDITQLKANDCKQEDAIMNMKTDIEKEFQSVNRKMDILDKRVRDGNGDVRQLLGEVKGLRGEQ